MKVTSAPVPHPPQNVGHLSQSMRTAERLVGCAGAPFLISAGSCMGKRQTSNIVAFKSWRPVKNLRTSRIHYCNVASPDTSQHSRHFFPSYVPHPAQLPNNPCKPQYPPPLYVSESFADLGDCI